MENGVHFYGIRHHGPGSARRLLRALEQLQPDILLVEGPADAQEALPWIAHQQMQPPVALLVYRPDATRFASYFPFAEFSPEWQALRFGFQQKVPCRLIDLPAGIHFAMEEVAQTALEGEGEETGQGSTEPEADVAAEVPQPDAALEEQRLHAWRLRMDPVRYLAESAGYSDSERWWEHHFEARSGGEDTFSAVAELITQLRAEAEGAAGAPPLERIEVLREAHMRQGIRSAQKEGFQRIAVVCGAWHVPALAAKVAVKEDKAHLAGLPKVKTAVTWVPWTNGRLASASGYGAGVESPGYYAHLWRSSGGQDLTAGWMGETAQLLREADLDASTANVIEAVRLAEALASLRGRSVPGLDEMLEASQSALCFGQTAPLTLIRERLTVGEVIGAIPDETPLAPLQEDLRRSQKTLRLKESAAEQLMDLDLRKPGDLARSHLFHRLHLLGVPWARRASSYSRSRGTFHEHWKLRWEPEFAIRLIEAGRYGNTVGTAAENFICERAAERDDLAELTALVETVMLADLPHAVEQLMLRVQALAALTGDVPLLIDALEPLVQVMRYGNVRKTDSAMAATVVDGLAARVCVGLPGACSSLDDEAAAAMYGRLGKAHSSFSLLEAPAHSTAWRETLRKVAAQPGVHGLVAGRAGRLLFELGAWLPEETERELGLALSRGNDTGAAAAWLEGFLRGSALMLIHNPKLWRIIDQWLRGLDAEAFQQCLPLLRRTFSTFPAPEIRQLGEIAKSRAAGPSSATTPQRAEPAPLDMERASRVLPIAARLLGLTAPQPLEPSPATETLPHE